MTPPSPRILNAALRRAEALWDDGEAVESLALAEDVLASDPGNERALKLKAAIQAGRPFTWRQAAILLGVVVLVTLCAVVIVYGPGWFGG